MGVYIYDGYAHAGYKTGVCSECVQTDGKQATQKDGVSAATTSTPPILLAQYCPIGR